MALIGLCFGLEGARLPANPVTDTSGFTNLVTVTFDALPNSGFVTGPVQVGTEVGESINWTSSPAGAVGVDNAAFGDNSYWNASFGRFATSAIDPGNPVYVQFDFSAPVSAVGGLLNYSTGPYNGNFGSVVFKMEALDSNGNVLETYDILNYAAITITTPNTAAFRGIVLDSDAIAAVRFQSDGRFYAIADLSYSRIAAVPEVATWSLWFGLLSLGGVIVLRRRNRRS